MDVVIVGGGHNGLVCAAYLAQAGRHVLVLERRPEVGGAAVSERPFAGHDARLSRYAYLVSLFPPRIADDLGISLRLATRPVAAYAPPDLLLRTAPTGPWDRFARLFPTLLERLPARAQAERLVGAEAWASLVERPLGETLREHFDDPRLRGVVATDGLIGTFASLYDPSLAQNRCFLWHVVGGPWRVPVGGMGALSGALAWSAVAAGAQLRTRAEVVRVDGGEVTWREDGREHTVTARHVVAGVAPAVLDGLRGREPAPAAQGCQTKVNLLLERLPALRSGVTAEEAFGGTFRLNESEDELEAAYAAAARGELPDPAPAELYCHSLTDPSIVAPGMHTLTLFGLHTPASLFDAHPGAKEALAAGYLDTLDEHLAEPIRDCISRDAHGEPCIEVKSPRDLERELGLPAGNIFHGELGWPWADDGAAGTWGVETDDDRILVCGAGAARGGGVSGIGGHNAAMKLLGR